MIPTDPQPSGPNPQHAVDRPQLGEATGKPSGPDVVPIAAGTASSPDPGNAVPDRHVAAEDLATEPAMAEALALLVQAVKDLQARGRRRTAAGVKSEMRRLTSRKFDEAALGFPSFRAFLDAASREGRVVAVAAAPGQDTLVLLPDEPDPTSAGRRGDAIRPDLWRAFVDWTPARIRVYDPQADRALDLPEHPQAQESGFATALRRRLEQDPRAFVTISPIGPARQHAWARDFVSRSAEALSGPEARDHLETALGKPHALGAFKTTLKLYPTLQSAWARELHDRVLAVIAEWSQTHSLKVDPLVSLVTVDEPAGANGSTGQVTHERTFAAGLTRQELGIGRGEASTASTSDAAALRATILEAVGRMSLAELLRLPIPAEHLLLR